MLSVGPGDAVRPPFHRSAAADATMLAIARGRWPAELAASFERRLAEVLAASAYAAGDYSAAALAVVLADEA